MRLFVGGLNYKTTQEGLRAAFEEDFAVTEAVIMYDRATGKSKGFGFVEIVTDKTPQDVVEIYENARIDGRNVTVNMAHPKPLKENGGNGHGRDAGREHSSHHNDRDERRQRAAGRY